MSSPIDFDVWESNSSVKDVKCWMTYTDTLFIEVKAYVEQATLLGLIDYRRMVPQYDRDSPETFSTRLVALAKLKSPVCPTTFLSLEEEKEDSCLSKWH